MRCRGLHGLANLLYLKGFTFSAVLRVAPYCAPGGVKVGQEFVQSKESPCRDFSKAVQTSCVVMSDSLGLDCGP